MTHPGPLLTDYVDGSLAPEEAAPIEDHLRTCATCREEVRLAGAARQALGATSTPAPPAGLAEAAIAEAERMATARAPEVTSLRTSASQRPRPSTPRWLAVAGAAAAIALIALVVPRLGQPGTSPASMEAAGGDVAHPPATTVEVQNVDYGSDIVARVAATFDSAVAGVGSAAPVEGAASGTTGPIPTLAGPEDAVKLAPERLAAAMRCLDHAYDNQDGTLTRVILARYDGQPAYLGVYLQGPGAGLEPNLVLVVVASVHGCEPLTTGQFRLR
jgi:anti-sigma factor RsiW